MHRHDLYAILGTSIQEYHAIRKKRQNRDMWLDSQLNIDRDYTNATWSTKE